MEERAPFQQQSEEGTHIQVTVAIQRLLAEIFLCFMPAMMLTNTEREGQALKWRAGAEENLKEALLSNYCSCIRHTKYGTTVVQLGRLH